MGRLINPMSQEEWEKLPNWQKWVSNHSMLLIFVFFLLLVAVVVAFNV